MYTTRNISLIAILTALAVTVKYAFGFFAGIELVTMLFCIYAVFTPLVVSMTTAIAFILAIGALYGVGTWWVMYFFIWPIEVFLGWSFKKVLRKNNIVFAFWTAFWGFSMIFWFAIHDMVVWDRAYALANMSTALFTNTIEGVVNFTGGLLLFYPCKKLFFEKLAYSEKIYW